MDGTKSMRTISDIISAERAEEIESSAKLRSERFKITIDAPPYGGVNRSNEIGLLTGASNQPMLSQAQIDARRMQTDYNNMKDSGAYKASVMKRVNDRSFI